MQTIRKYPNLDLIWLQTQRHMLVCGEMNKWKLESPLFFTLKISNHTQNTGKTSFTVHLIVQFHRLNMMSHGKRLFCQALAVDWISTNPGNI